MSNKDQFSPLLRIRHQVRRVASRPLSESEQVLSQVLSESHPVLTVVGEIPCPCCWRPVAALDPSVPGGIRRLDFVWFGQTVCYVMDRAWQEMTTDANRQQHERRFRSLCWWCTYPCIVCVNEGLGFWVDPVGR